MYPCMYVCVKNIYATQHTYNIHNTNPIDPSVDLLHVLRCSNSNEFKGFEQLACLCLLLTYRY